MKKGLFVTVEGGDGVGKSTLLAGLQQALKQQGKTLLTTREPGGTALAEQVRDILLNQDHPLSPRAELFLFLAARAEQFATRILPALERGETVLCDRFHDSSIAYQGMARGLGEKAVTEICAFASGGYHPDLTFYLDLAPEIAEKRTGKEKDRIERENHHFHDKVRQAYLSLAQQHPERIKVLDATKTPDELLKETLEVLQTNVAPLP